MGLLDWFRKPKPTLPLAQLCYDVAYFILPHYAYRNLSEIITLCRDAPTAAGPNFYLLATQARNVEPIIEDAKQFRWEYGTLVDGVEFYMLEYPPPAPIDLTDVPDEAILSGQVKVILAPYLSLVLCGQKRSAEYYVLGQAPLGGGTTVRSVAPDGKNLNLGPGPEPVPGDFLEFVRQHEIKKLVVP